MKRPRYVTIEGVDSVGKTTLVTALRDHYQAAGLSVATKPEFPADPAIEREISQALDRSIFIGEGFAGGTAAAFFFMFYAEMMAVRSLPSTADITIGDRGIDSLCLYQGFLVRGREHFNGHEVLSATEMLFTRLGLRLPERTLLLTLPAAELHARFCARNGRDPSADELSKLVWLQQEFLAVAASS